MGHKTKCMFKDGLKGQQILALGNALGIVNHKVRHALEGQKNVYTKPNGQSQDCLNDVMARKIVGLGGPTSYL